MSTTIQFTVILGAAGKDGKLKGYRALHIKDVIQEREQIKPIL